MNQTNHYYFIDSYDKQQGQTDVNFTVRPHRYNDIRAIELKHILIPYTFYNVNSTNNVLVIFKTGDTQQRNIVLPPGNYNITDFLAKLKVFLDASSGPLHTYTCTYDVNSYKITITQDSSTFVIFANSTMRHLLGLGNVDPVANISHTSAHVFDLSYTNIIKVYSNALTKFDSRFSSSNTSDSGILTVIPIHDALFGENIKYQFRTYYIDVHSMNEEFIDIRFADKYGNQLGGDTGLNNKSCYLKLKFTTFLDTDERKYNRYK
jgi:hypothetical protein